VPPWMSKISPEIHSALCFCLPELQSCKSADRVGHVGHWPKRTGGPVFFVASAAMSQVSQMSQDFYSILYFCISELHRDRTDISDRHPCADEIAACGTVWQRRSDLARLLDDHRGGVRVSQNDSRGWSVGVLGDHPPAAARSAPEVVNPRRVEQIGEVYDVWTIAAALRTRGSCRGHETLLSRFAAVTAILCQSWSVCLSAWDQRNRSPSHPPLIRSGMTLLSESLAADPSVARDRRVGTQQ
jgi:hypothetical protein